jgi:hypothetical protein
VEDYVKSLILGVDAILPLKNLITYMKSFWFGRVGAAWFSVFFGEPQDQQRRGILAQIFKSEDDREKSDIMEIYWYQNLN